MLRLKEIAEYCIYCEILTSYYELFGKLYYYDVHDASPLILRMICGLMLTSFVQEMKGFLSMRNTPF